MSEIWNNVDALNYGFYTVFFLYLGIKVGAEKNPQKKKKQFI